MPGAQPTSSCLNSTPLGSGASWLQTSKAAWARLLHSTSAAGGRRSPGVLDGVLLKLWERLAGFMGDTPTGLGPGPLSLALRCHRAGGAFGIGVSSLSSPCRSASNRNCAMVLRAGGVSRAHRAGCSLLRQAAPASPAPDLPNPPAVPRAPPHHRTPPVLPNRSSGHLPSAETPSLPPSLPSSGDLSISRHPF